MSNILSESVLALVRGLHSIVSFSYEYYLATINLWLLGFHSNLSCNICLPLGFPLCSERNILLKSIGLDQGFTSDSLVLVRILVSVHKPLASWLPFNLLFHFWFPLGFPLSEAKGWKVEANGDMKDSMKLNCNQ